MILCMRASGLAWTSRHGLNYLLAHSRSVSSIVLYGMRDVFSILPTLTALYSLTRSPTYNLTPSFPPPLPLFPFSPWRVSVPRYPPSVSFRATPEHTQRSPHESFSSSHSLSQTAHPQPTTHNPPTHQPLIHETRSIWRNVQGNDSAFIHSFFLPLLLAPVVPRVAKGNPELPKFLGGFSFLFPRFPFQSLIAQYFTGVPYSTQIFALKNRA